MPRDRVRLTLESGPVLDLACLIPRGAGRPGAHIVSTCADVSGLVIQTEIALHEDGGDLVIRSGDCQQTFRLVSSPCCLGGQQWYVVCPKTWKRVRMLYRPGGAPYFASRHAWGRQAAFASQFLDPVGRAWRTKAKVKARLLGSEDPDEWDLPPKPKGMRWATYERWVAKYDGAEEALDRQLALACVCLMGRG